MEMLFRSADFEVYKINNAYFVKNIENGKRFFKPSLDDAITNALEDLTIMECEKAFALLDVYEEYKELHGLKK